MKKKLLIFSVLLSMLFFSVISAFAQDDNTYILDYDSEELTQEEVQLLNERAEEIYRETGYKVFFSRFNDAGVSVINAAKSKFEANCDNGLGIILAINTAPNLYYVYTPEESGLSITTQDMESLYDAYYYPSTEYDGILQYLNMSKAFISLNVTSNPIKKDGNIDEEKISENQNTDSTAEPTVEPTVEPVNLNLGPELRLVDDAGLLTSSQQQELLVKLDEISEKHNLDVVIITKNSIDGKTPMAYADDFYDYHEYKKDGILLLISMAERDFWISTTGYGITAFTDKGLEYIESKFLPSLSAGNYYAAFNKFGDLSDQFITQAKTGQPYDVGNMPKAPYSLIWIPVGAIGGLIVGFLYTQILKGQLKSVKKQYQATNYIVGGSLRFNDSRELLVNKHVTKTFIPKNNSSGSGRSGGGSSTHFGSSGVRHGGRGGKF